jgi:hypothetical protein
MPPGGNDTKNTNKVARQEKVFTYNIKYGRSRGRKERLPEKVTVSIDVVVQAFTPTSSNLHTVAVGVPTLPGRQGAAMVQQQPCLAAAPRDTSQDKCRRSLSESPPPAKTGKADQQQADPTSSSTEASPRKEDDRWRGEEGQDQKKP